MNTHELNELIACPDKATEGDIPFLLELIDDLRDMNYTLKTTKEDLEFDKETLQKELHDLEEQLLELSGPRS